MLLAHTNNDAQDYYKLGATFAIQQDFIAAKVTCQLLSYELGLFILFLGLFILLLGLFILLLSYELGLARARLRSLLLSLALSQKHVPPLHLPRPGGLLHDLGNA